MKTKQEKRKLTIKQLVNSVKEVAIQIEQIANHVDETTIHCLGFRNKNEAIISRINSLVYLSRQLEESK